MNTTCATAGMRGDRGASSPASHVGKSLASAWPVSFDAGIDRYVGRSLAGSSCPRALTADIMAQLLDRSHGLLVRGGKLIRGSFELSERLGFQNGSQSRTWPQRSRMYLNSRLKRSSFSPLVSGPRLFDS